MADFIKSYRAEVGINHVPAYQVSGRPFASSSTDGRSGTVVKVEFPFVTRWIYVVNSDGSNAATVGFSENGLGGTNFFKVKSGTSSEVLDLKISELYLTGSSDLTVVAGLTTISPVRLSGSTGPSFSGSVGVG
tara:strand:- start:125 stop:523 length:399 start_codon:yes stop_codon:yes gene_type:complete